MPRKDPVERKAYNAERWQKRKNDPDFIAKAKVRSKKWCQDNKEKHATTSRIYRLKSKFDLTIEEYQKLWDEQGGLCAICNCPETSIDPRSGKLKWLTVDHDHETRKVRGLLCSACNKGLGHFSDDSEILIKAADYLKKQRG